LAGDACESPYRGNWTSLFYQRQGAAFAEPAFDGTYIFKTTWLDGQYYRIIATIRS
jgi:hypothetical protein